ncbi:AraC family transcriptional regulator [Lentzea sp. NPDC003310]|uniref:AraC family transcriptional regulator n=1 Tax=Lentzea sp. NPDC003310 TaxID=3154447 RepID=UPI0033A0AECB
MLEQVLSALSVNWAVATPLHAGGRWALHFVGRLDLRVEVVLRGRVHVTVAGQGFWAEQGDCYVIAGRRPYRIAADPDTSSVFAAPYYEDEHGTPRDTARIGEGHDTTLLGAGFTCDPEDAQLLQVLPPVLHVRTGAVEATIELIRSEIDGSKMILDRLCQVLLLQVVRDHASEEQTQLAPALEAMQDLRHPWTVNRLASAAAMSRSTFFLRFREATGLTPLDYLYRLRMRHAAHLLRDTADTVGSISAAVGYRTESAFCAAFRRFSGRSPGDYRTGSVT